MCLTTNQISKPPLDILDDDCVNRPIPANKPGPLEESPASPDRDNTGSVAIPPSYKSQDPSPPSSNGHTRGGTPPKFGMHPLREVTDGEMGTVRDHVPFSMAELVQIKQQLGQYSKNPSQYMEDYKQLTIMFHLTWQDIYII